MQVLQAEWDETFSETSFGFRPGRSAHQAVERAQTYIASGHAVVVDIDLEKFFDRVMYGRIWTPPDCNTLIGSGAAVTTADVYPAS